MLGVSAACVFLLAGCSTPELPPLSKWPGEPPRPDRVPETQPEASSAPMTLEQALQRASTHNPQLHALQAAVSVAKQRKAAASDFEDPEAMFAWGNIGDEFASGQPVGNTEKEWRVGGKFYVPNPFLISPRVSARTADLLAAKADLQFARWGLQCEVRRLFAQIHYLREDLALMQDLAQVEGEVLKDVRARAEQGAATASDVVAASQKQLQSENDLALCRHQYQLAQRDLAALLDLSPSGLQLATNDMNYPVATESGPLDADTLQQAAFKYRGDLTALRWRAVAAKSSITEARNVRVPWFKEINFWNREPGDQWWLGAQVTIPVFSWTKNHAEDVVEAQSDLAGVNETNGMQLIRRELHDALDELAEQQRQQAHNDEYVLPLLKEMRETLQLLKNTPNLMPSQVAASQAQFLESSRIELAAGWRYHLALLNVERVLGEPLGDALRPGAGRKM